MYVHVCVHVTPIGPMAAGTGTPKTKNKNKKKYMFIFYFLSHIAHLTFQKKSCRWPFISATGRTCVYSRPYEHFGIHGTNLICVTGSFFDTNISWNWRR